MSGHSHWSSIKHKKGAADAKKSKMFSKMAKEIAVAAREGGGSLEFNPKLRIVTEKARSLNMPAENIERAVKRGTGELEGAKLEPVTLEAYGPGGIAIVIEGITDNKNRTLGEIKQILNQKGGKLVAEGGVKWMFEKKGCITADPKEQAEGRQNKENLELASIEAGAEDVRWHDGVLEVYTKPEKLEETREAMEKSGIKTESASLDWVAKETVELTGQDKDSCQSLFEALDENEAVQEIYSNLNA